MPSLSPYRRESILQASKKMKIFLSSLEAGPKLEDSWLGRVTRETFPLKYNLVSFFYARGGGNYKRAVKIRDVSDLVLVDSGAHSFQKGAKADWDKYTERYCQFIKEFDKPNVLGYFEMDIDAIIGEAKVKELRRRLMKVSPKIIPVWHKNRGIAEFKEMCERHKGGIVAISGFKNEDIRDEDFIKFLKEAHQHNCRLHCLGMTRREILDKVPFDYVDSSTWKQYYAYAKIGQTRVNSNWFRSKRGREIVNFENYKI